MKIKNTIKAILIFTSVIIVSGLIGIQADHSDKMLTPEQIKPDDLNCGG